MENVHLKDGSVNIMSTDAVYKLLLNDSFSVPETERAKESIGEAVLDQAARHRQHEA